jgi:uncharacterized protein (DUF2062 family)
MAFKREKKHIFLRLIRLGLRKIVYEFKNIRNEPSQIAWGGAIGIFVAVTPTMGIQTVLALFIATLFRANRIIAGVLVWITNVFTAIPLYFVVCYAGKLILSRTIDYKLLEQVSWYDWHSYWDFFITHFLALWLGALVLGTVGGGITYILLFNLTKYFRRIRERKREKRSRKDISEDAEGEKGPGCGD